MSFPSLPRHVHSVWLLLFFFRENTLVDHESFLTLLFGMVSPFANFYLLFIRADSARDANVRIDVLVDAVDFDLLY